jgi:hypothetical protein
MEILTVGASITVINIKKTWKFADDNTNTGGPLQWNHSEFKYVSNAVSYYKVFSTIHALPFSIIMKYEGTTYIFLRKLQPILLWGLYRTWIQSSLHIFKKSFKG